MKYIFSAIEQLDLAARQLEHVRPSFARFALLLVDNSVELLLHSACTSEINSLSATLSTPPKYDAETAKKVLGNHFDEKTRFCRQSGIITDDEFEFINTGHKYRNELYHIGIRHDDLIYPLAWQYHELACDLFAKLRPRVYQWWPPNVETSDAVKWHWKEESPLGDLDAQFVATRESLKRLKPSMSPSFAEQVSAYAEQTVVRLDEALDFLVNDNPNGDDEATVLEDIQFSDHFQNSLGERMVGFHSVSELEGLEHWKTLFDRAKASWQPKYRSRPTQRWRNRAIALRHEANPSDVVRKYNGLISEMSWFEGVVHEAAYELDTWIQLQIDIARGK
jgi:hypothetical protein